MRPEDVYWIDASGHVVSETAGSLTPFWDAVAANSSQRDLLKGAMAVAFGIDDPELAAMLLAPASSPTRTLAHTSGRLRRQSANTFTAGSISPSYRSAIGHVVRAVHTH